MGYWGAGAQPGDPELEDQPPGDPYEAAAAERHAYEQWLARCAEETAHDIDLALHTEDRDR